MAPAEIEAVLRQHKYIADAAVFGVRREDGLTQVPKALIVRKSEPEAQFLHSHDVYNFARDRLAKFKALEGGIVFVNSIPRSPTGKIQRFKLKDVVGSDGFVANGEAPLKALAIADKESDKDNTTLEIEQRFANGRPLADSSAVEEAQWRNESNVA